MCVSKCVHKYTGECMRHVWVCVHVHLYVHVCKYVQWIHTFVCRSQRRRDIRCPALSPSTLIPLSRVSLNLEQGWGRQAPGVTGTQCHVHWHSRLRRVLEWEFVSSQMMTLTLIHRAISPAPSFWCLRGLFQNSRAMRYCFWDSHRSKPLNRTIFIIIPKNL